jgi:hypothetical protein
MLQVIDKLQKIYGCHYELVYRYGIFVTDDHEYASFVAVTVLSSSFMICNWILMSNTTGASSGTGTIYASRASVFNAIFNNVSFIK